MLSRVTSLSRLSNADGNGVLIAAAEQAGFDVLVTTDKNLRYQQNLTKRRIAIVELWTNHRPTLEKHWALIGKTAEAMLPGEYRALGAP